MVTAARELGRSPSEDAAFVTPVFGNEPLPPRPSAPPQRGPESVAFRLTDTFVVLALLLGSLLYTSWAEIKGLDDFLVLRVSVKNALLSLAFLVYWQALFTFTTNYARQRGGGAYNDGVGVAIACTLAALGALVVPLVGLSGAFGVNAVLLFWVISVPAVLIARIAVRFTITVVRRSVRMRQAIIVGSGPRALATFRSVRDCPHTGYHVLGFVDSNTTIDSAEIRERFLGELSDLEKILMHRNVDVVLIALPVKSKYSSIQDAIQVCGRVGVESRYLADIFHGRLPRHEYQPAGSLPAVAMKVVHDDSRLIVKRLIDLVGATIGLILLLPVLAAIAMAIRHTSPGPVFFAQERYGLNRRVFRMYKFRTMVSDAATLQYALEHLNEATGPAFKIKNDPRITPLGRFLRRTSLDELPQLFHVLTGEMSLVGPRPMSLRDVKLFPEASLMRRFSVTPGLTCLWQVSGRSNLDFSDWMRLDLEYIDSWSLGRDFVILLQTVPAVLRGTGAV